MSALLERIAALSPEKRRLLVQRLDPLSLVQEPIWFLHRFASGVPAYNIPLPLAVSGPLDCGILERTMRTIATRHEILRTTFPAIDGQPVQLVAPEAAVALPIVDLGAVASDRVDSMQQRLLDLESRRLFDVEQGPLWRCLLLRRSRDEHVLMLTIHHLIFDGWSRGVLLGELAMCYDAYANGRAPSLPPLPLQYRQFARWHRARLDDDTFDAQIAYWSERLGGELPVLELPTDRPRPPQFTYRGADIMFSLSPDVTQQLRTLVRDAGLTLFMLLLAAWTLLLQRYSGQDDIVVGTATSGRTRRECENLIGCFINALPLRVSTAGNPTVSELLARVREVALGAYAHQDVPFERVLGELQPERRLDRSPIFTTSLMLLNTPPISVGGGVGVPLRVQEIAVADRAARFDLALALMDTPNGLSGPLRYATDLFDATTIRRLLDHLTQLLVGMVTQPDQRISELQILTPVERQQIDDWNATTRTWAPRLVFDLLEEQAARVPDAVAVIDREGSCDYRTLHERANRLARWLRQQGVDTGARVGLCMGRSRHAITALLAVLKAGAAYVPLDPAAPSVRLAFQLADAGVAVLLTDVDNADAVPSGSYTVHVLADGSDVWESESPEPPTVAVACDDLAYIIYTSGSTGQPKGVMVTHGGLLNYLCWARETYPLADGHGTLFHSSLAFDLTVTSVLGPLVAGAAIRIVSGRDGIDELAQAFRSSEDLGFVKATPSHLHALDTALAKNELAGRTRALVVGGEALDAAIVDRWLARAPSTTIFNEYGPTETVVGCCVQKIVAGERWTDPTPIGRPIANTRLYVMSPHGQLAPIGVAGELWIGGAGVARGYLDRPDLTADRFVPDPFSATPGARLYRTGDRVRYRSGGVLEYLGRYDHQVKLRGNRIELGEIEAALRQQPGIDDAVVVLREDAPGEQRLVAYVVASADATRSVDTLQQILRARLPEYMVPAAIVWLDALPLTPSGKIDRRQLRAPGSDRPVLTQTFVAPRTPIETALAQIWAGVLRLDRVGIHDNFFALGGDSIVSLQIVARATQAGLRIAPRQVFEHQTIAALAQAVQLAAPSSADQAPLVGPVPLLPMQHRFFSVARPSPHHNNQQVRLELTPTAPVAVLEHAWGALVRHHDALRVRFTQTADGWTQTGTPDEGAHHVPRIDLQGVAPAHQSRLQWRVTTAAQASLNLTDGPLARAVLLVLPGPVLHAFFVVHHLVIDGVSWRVLLMDLHEACLHLQAGQPVMLPPKTSSVRQWAEGLQALAASGALADEIAVWNEMSAPAATLPRDLEGANTGPTARAHVDALSEEVTQALIQELPARGVGHVQDLLLAALVQALAGWTNEPTWRIDLEGHGREELSGDLDVSRTVGWFTSLYPIRLTAASDPLSTLRAVKSTLRAIPRHGLAYGVLRYVDSSPDAEPVRAAAPAEIIFNYLGQTGQVLGQGGWLRLGQGPVGLPHHPGQPREYMFEITGIVVDNRLQLSWSYSGQVHRPATIERLMERFTEALSALIASSREPHAARRWLVPADFPLAEIAQQELETVAARGPVADIYPLSPMQQGLLFHSVYESESSLLYTVRYRARIEGTLDTETFRRAWQTVVARHDILRTGFHWNRAGRPLQVVYDAVEMPCVFEDWRHVPPADREARLVEYLADDERRGFDLEQAPLMRMALVRLDEARWHAAWTLHHLITDGWSVQLVMAEVMAVYAAIASTQPVPELPAGRYRDYIAWLQRQDLDKAEAFWRRTLEGVTSPSLVAGDARSTAHQTIAKRSIHAVVSPSLMATLQQLGRARSLTMNTWLVGAWALLLAHQTEKRDVVFGTVVSGRPPQLRGIELTPGMFVNTLPVRATAAPNEALGSWLRQLQAQQTDARDYEYTPLNQIQSWSAIPPSVPLFDTLFAFENYPIAPPRDGGDADVRVIRADSDLVIPTSYPIVLEFAPSSETVGIRMTFDTTQVADAVAQEILNRFQVLLERMAATPDATIGSLLDVLAAAEAETRVQEREQAERRREGQLKNLRRASLPQ